MMMGLHSIVGAHANYRPTTDEARLACGVARVELMKRRRGLGGQPVTAQCMLKHYTEGGDRGLEFDMCKSLTSSTAAQWEDDEYRKAHTHVASFQVRHTNNMHFVVL